MKDALVREGGRGYCEEFPKILDGGREGPRIRIAWGS